MALSFTIGRPDTLKITEASPTKYDIVMGESSNPESDFIVGRKIKIFAKLRGTWMTKRMIGDNL